jgi:DNA modification methylase
MAKKTSGGASVPASRSPDATPAREDARSTSRLKSSSLVDTRVVYCGDNLEQLAKLPDACVDLIYIDPPFNSNRNYEVFWGETKEKRSFDDRHESTKAYIEYMKPRCVQLARVLKKTGSFYYHCDWHASHYVKVMLDQIFGENNFVNEIIWKRQTSHNDAKQGSKHYGRLHDVLMFYSGGSEDYTWNQQYVPLDESYIESHYSQVDEKGRRFQWGDLRAPGGAAPSKGNPHYKVLGVDGYWRYSQEKMEQFIREGRVAIPGGGNTPRYKRYLDESKGLPVGSVWDDINPINSQAKESLGYPTQKPLPLLERILKTSSNENDIVLDAFCGCGTALVAAQLLKRQWIGIDYSPTACRVMAKRLKDKNVCGLPESEELWAIGRGFIVRDLPKTEAELRKYPHYEFENWAVVALGGIANKVKVGDMGIDGRIYPVSAVPERRGKAAGEFAFTDEWYPIQVKQTDKVGRPDVDAFEAVMIREERKLGYFVGFDFTGDALFEIDRFQRKEGRTIKPLTVREILDEEIVSKSV